MTVNRTTLLDLPLPVTGTESGTWGDTTNNGLTQYVDIAVAGMTSLTSANFTAGALTLANTTGDSSATNIAAGSAQYGAIKVSSLATNSTITAPSSNRRYTIINADATYSVTIKASGQTGVTIVAGEKALVAFNGTDYVKIATANGTGEFTTVDTTNLEVTNIKAKDGTAAATIADSTGVVTVTAAPVMTALTASQAVFTTAGKALTSNAITGTGNVVMSASPTLTGTISAAAATLSGNLTLSGGTANGVLYLNGSKVATSGSALTFDGSTLTNTGALSIQGNTTLGNASTDTVTVNGYMGVGGAATASMSVYARSSALTGSGQGAFYADIVGSSAATTEISGFRSSIRTEATAFTVSDLAHFRAFNAVKGAGSTITNQHGLYIADQTQGTNNYGITSLVSSGTDKWNIYASGTAANYFAGNLLINTTSTVGGQKLSINGGVGLIGSNTNQQLDFYRINGSSIVANGDTVAQILARGYNGTSYNVMASIVMAVDGTPGATNDMPGRIVFNTTADGAGSPTERARIDASGNLGLGVTPSAWGTSGSAYKAIQYGVSGFLAGRTGNETCLLGTGAYNDGTNWRYLLSGNFASLYSQASGQHVWLTAPSGTAGNTISFTQAMTLDAHGDLGVGTTSPTTVSNYRAITVNGTNGGILDLKYGDTLGGRVVASSGGLSLETGGANVLAFYTNNTERARITSGGDLLVGTTSVTTGVSGTETTLTLQGNSSGKAASYVAVNAAGTGSGFVGVGTNNLTYVFSKTNHALIFGTNSTERARITNVGNFKIGGTADRGTTEGDKQLVLFDGTAPVGTLTNGVSFYSASGEARVMDAAGNSTLLSPHDAKTNEWIFHSKHTPTGKVLRIDVERLLKFVNDHFGLDAVQEFIEP